MIEVKKDLRVGSVRSDAIAQLAGYVRSRAKSTGRRYVGVLTDGAEWDLYYLQPDGLLAKVSAFVADPAAPDPRALCDWLDSVVSVRGAIMPTPDEIRHRLGSESPAFRLDMAEMRAVYEKCRDLPEVKLKRELWAKLLRLAFGEGFVDDTELFLEHTYLVLSAEAIAHAVVGFDLALLASEPARLLSGAEFVERGIAGVVESDFFDWLCQSEDGLSLVTAITRRLAHFDWSATIEHDLCKVLYQAVIPDAERKRLGEYYTPDWLASRMVSEIITEPTTQRVLDPSCGSGTFLFHAVTRCMDAVLAQGKSVGDAIDDVCGRVLGVDIHPVAVTLARVTYLLALGTARLVERNGPLALPVYLGDSLLLDQEGELWDHGGIRVETRDHTLLADDLVFPSSLLSDAGQFDRLIAQLASRATNRPKDHSKVGKVPPIKGILDKYGVQEEDREVLTSTFAVWCGLHDLGRNHIWGYYIRNRARPHWLSRSENRVDCLIGNPPWLSYRFMPEDFRKRFVAMSKARGLWGSSSIATNMDLSGLFVARSVQMYLRQGGRFGFVMPHAALGRPQFEGFRTGTWPATNEEPAFAKFETPWDMDKVQSVPAYFPVPACVVKGVRVSGTVEEPSSGLAGEVDVWSGQLPAPDCTWAEAEASVAVVTTELALPGGVVSPYLDRFKQGAALVPRVLVCVEEVSAGPLGGVPGSKRVRSHRTNQEKAPWKGVASLQRDVEVEFVRPMHLGLSVAPFRLLEPWSVVIPWLGDRPLSVDEFDLYPGIDGWWEEASELWHSNGGSSMSLMEQLDYQGKLTGQLPAPPHRIVYVKSSSSAVSARVDDPAVVIDNALYWAAVSGPEEGLYLEAVFNSRELTRLVEPLLSRGQYGARNLNRYLFQLPIPLWDPDNELHAKLSEAASVAEGIASGVDIAGLQSSGCRSRIRAELVATGVMDSIDALVQELLGSTPEE